MAEPQVCQFSRVGLTGVVSATYTTQWSITPGVGVVQSRRPLASVDTPNVADVTMGDGIREVVLKDCRLEESTLSVDSGGQLWTTRFEDERWKWREFGVISGVYNDVDANGKLVPWTVRKPKELAILCLNAMDWRNYEIDLPEGLGTLDTQGIQDYLTTGVNLPESGTNPRIEWNAENPAAALARLADEFGRVVVFDPIKRFIKIVPPGDGAELPSGTGCTISLGAGVRAKAKPDFLCVLGAPVEWQLRLRLYPVGREWDGRYIPIENLSYRPVPVGTAYKAWDFADPSTLGGVRATARQTEDQAKQAALSSVWRTYRAENIDPGPRSDPSKPQLVIPRFGALTRRHQIVMDVGRIDQVIPAARDEDLTNPGKAAPFEEYYDGRSRDQGPAVYGSVDAGRVRGIWRTRTTGFENTTDGDEIPVGVSIDPESGIVTFDRPMCLFTKINNSTNRYGFRPAPLVIETRVRIKDAKTGEFIRFKYWRAVGAGVGLTNEANLNDGPPADKLTRYVLRDDCVLQFVAWYTHADGPAATYTGNVLTAPAEDWYGGTYSINRLETRRSDTKRANEHLKSLDKEYEEKPSTRVDLAGIWPIEQDGAIQMVTWSVGVGGIRTTASRNGEHSPYVPPLAKRRKAENLNPDPKGAAQNTAKQDNADRLRNTVAALRTITGARLPI